jgi:hypothetical protein
MTNSGTSKQWQFFRAGGFNQVALTSGADLMALDQLDQKLWVALACPTSGLEFDKATLALIDTDKDGRWACAGAAGAAAGCALGVHSEAHGVVVAGVTVLVVSLIILICLLSRLRFYGQPASPKARRMPAFRIRP